MSKQAKKSSNKSPVPGYEFVRKAGAISEHRLRVNGLRVLHLKRPNTNTVTTNITYLVGAKDEAREETGVAHMLEHMLFKPTIFDKKRKVSGCGADQFESATGAIMNANTWKDRTTYYFNYPVEHVDRALQVEAERMVGVIINDKELTPEKGNVLSEHDMYNGMPHFALSVQMVSTAFHSHPYGHETIGYREDIEDYTPAKLERFYRNYYRPDNAIMMVIGDISLEDALKKVKKAFTHLKNPDTAIPRFAIREPKQEGLRRATVQRPSAINLVSLGFLAPGFATEDWFGTAVMGQVLTGGPESILHKLLVDTGKATEVSYELEPSAERNLAMITVSLAQGESHEEIEQLVLSTIQKLKLSDISRLVKKKKAKFLTQELFEREHSRNIAQELTEYVAADSWESYQRAPEFIAGVTPQNVLTYLREYFNTQHMTIGYFVGTQK